MWGLALAARFAGVIALDTFSHLSTSEQRPMFARFAALASPGAAVVFTSGTEEGSAIG